MKDCVSVAVLARARWDLLETAGGELNAALERRAWAALEREGAWFHVPVRGKVSAGRSSVVRRPSPTREESNKSRDDWESGMVVAPMKVLGWAK
jgi:hypothetical protein